MSFSNCGNFLYGVRLGVPQNGEPVFLYLAQHFSNVPLTLNGKAEDSRGDYSTSLSVSASVGSSSQIMASSDQHWEIESTNKSISSIPQFTKFQGQLQISALSQDTDSRSVVLQTMRSDGKLIEEIITRLPQATTLEKSYSTLVPAESHKNLRLVLNMALQDTYSASEESDFQLPAVLDRDKESIPRFEYTQTLALEEKTGPWKRMLERGNEAMIGPSKSKKQK